MDNKIKLCAIVAMAENNVIGGDNKLLWHLPEDLKHFKKTTMGKPLIMGRKTFESLPGVLPGRPHIVISRRDAPAHKHKNVHHAQSIEDGIQTAQNWAIENSANEIFITGGGEIYKQTLPSIERLYLTIVHQDFAGDTTFPHIDWSVWRTSDKTIHATTDTKLTFTIFTLDRI